jgi:hypothetical protein
MLAAGSRLPKSDIRNPKSSIKTTIAAAGGIPGNSLVEIDVIAYI